MLYYNDEGYQIDPETNQILDTPVNRRLYSQREHQRRINKAANPKLEQAANRFINLNPKNTTNKSSNKNITTNNQSNNTPIQQYNWGQGRKPFYGSSNKLTSNSFAKPLNSTSQTKNKTTNKQSTSTNTTHKVKSGDSPWQIAKDNGMTLNTFYKLNPNARNGIYPGDVVNVNKSANIHKVKSGDSPWQIAKDNNISLDELYRLNPEARNMIYPGDELILPDKTRNKKRYGGPLKKRKNYDDWYKTIPTDRNDTTSYNLRRAYELAPINELEAWRTSSIRDLEAGKNHLRSVYINPKTGIYEFMKSKSHPTINMELDWYNGNTPDAINFKKQYDLDTSGDYYKYVPKSVMEVLFVED